MTNTAATKETDASNIPSGADKGRTGAAPPELAASKVEVELGEDGPLAGAALDLLVEAELVAGVVLAEAVAFGGFVPLRPWLETVIRIEDVLPSYPASDADAIIASVLPPVSGTVNVPE